MESDREDRRPPTGRSFSRRDKGSVRVCWRKGGGEGKELERLGSEEWLDTQLNVIKLIGPADNQANYRYQSTIGERGGAATPTGLFYSDDKPH